MQEWEQELSETQFNEVLHPYSGYEVCGHCLGTSAWKIVSTMVTEPGAIWIEYECDKHAKRWWPELFSS